MPKIDSSYFIAAVSACSFLVISIYFIFIFVFYWGDLPSLPVLAPGKVLRKMFFAGTQTATQIFFSIIIIISNEWEKLEPLP